MVVLPLYSSIDRVRLKIEPALSPMGVWMGDRQEWCAVHRADMDGVRVGPWVLHRMTSTIADIEPLQLFHLESDPAEKNNLAFSRPAVRALLEALLARQQPAGAAPPAPDDVVRDSLRTLQYLR